MQRNTLKKKSFLFIFSGHMPDFIVITIANNMEKDIAEDNRCSNVLNCIALEIKC